MFYRPLYAIKDVKSGFTDPCVQVNDSVAVRSFECQIPRLVQDCGIPLSDLQLWRIGQYDLDSGLLRPETPELILDGSSLHSKVGDVIEKPECEDSEDL